MRSFVIGGAGFVGSHLADLLVLRGPVTLYDNMTIGKRAFVAAHLAEGRITLVEADALDLDALKLAMAGHDVVFHLAANPEARWGLERTRLDLEQGTIATYNALEAARLNGIKKFVFASSGTVYGNVTEPCGEGDLGSLPISLYGASKVAGEGLISAYAEGGQIDEAYIFRFVSILGERYTHGHVFDFYKQLLEHPGHLRVLGDGTQRKSYLYVQDCVDAILHVTRQHTARDAKHHTQIYNLGTPEYVQVNQSIGYLCAALGVTPKIEHTGGNKGWIGDNPFIFLDTKKIQSTGWKAKLTIEQGIIRTLCWLEANRWVYENRH